MLNFILNDTFISTDAPAGMPLLDFIRREQRLTGTKIGCREGDCGACTVLAGSLQEDGTVHYRSITSCISPLGNAGGKHIVTVEGVNLPNKLNVSQQAMKEQNGTQCGFCTPGFVVSLTGFCLNHRDSSLESALDSISGNICRCTGYKSIIRAAGEINERLKNRKDGLQWLITNEFIPAYFAQIPARLAKLPAAEHLPENGPVVAGGTDLYVRGAERLAETNVRLVAHREELRGMSVRDNVCTVGASTTVTDLLESDEFRSCLPQLASLLKLVSSEPIRNMATLAGNFVNASPIGDMTIIFLALNSRLHLKNSEGKVRIVALKDFYHGYKTLDLENDELIVNIDFKLPDKTSRFNFEKVSKRTFLDIASVNSAIRIKTNGEFIETVHLALGGVAPIPKYLPATVRFLSGKPLTPETLIAGNSVLQDEISPISDVRGAADYKRLLARQLFFAHFLKLFPERFTLEELIAP